MYYVLYYSMDRDYDGSMDWSLEAFLLSWLFV